MYSGFQALCNTDTHLTPAKATPLPLGEGERERGRGEVYCVPPYGYAVRHCRRLAAARLHSTEKRYSSALGA